LLPSAVLLLRALGSLLATMETVVTIRWRPDGQDGKGLPAGRAQSAPNEDKVVKWIVCLFAPLSMADDGSFTAHRTQPWQQADGNRGYPGSVLSSAFGSAIKRITAGVRACAMTAPARFDRVAGLPPPDEDSIKRKKNPAFCPLASSFA
jgi:hypothetical protein